MKKILLPILLIACLSCTSQGQNRTFTIAFYNVENLYDTINDPAVDDEEFLPAGKNKWTGERYAKKLSNLSRVIDTLGGGPSLLGLCEVENEEVLKDLASQPLLKSKNYQVVHRHSPDKRGIDVALLYRKGDFQPESVSSLRVNLPGDSALPTRDILLVAGKLNGQSLYAFINHWPSRRGGEQESAGKRMAAALVARKAVDSLLKINKDAHIVLMGDFNDQPSDASLTQGLKAEGLSGKSDLVNLSAALAEKGLGSHSYKETWNMLDNLIVSRTMCGKGKGLKVLPESASIYNPVWMHDKYAKHAGAPYRTYAGPKFIGGFSDHYPVYFKVSCP
jgi:predicted extracellular nuclease